MVRNSSSKKEEKAMYQDLEGRVVIVTGASKGIGRGIAERLGKEKMKVIVNYRSDQEGGEEAASFIREQGGEAVAVQADVAKEEDTKRLFKEAIEHFGKVDALINNAGFSIDSPSHQLSLDDWNKVLNVNLTGAFLGSREAISHMLENEIKGTIINISSVHQQIPKINNTHYATTKGGMKMMTETMALEYANKGIRINAIAPGTIETEGNPVSEKEGKDMELTMKKIPVNRVGKPEHIAAAAAWLISEEADYVTGTTLFVDGGMTLYPSQLE